MNPKYLVELLNETYQHHASSLQEMRKLIQCFEQAKVVVRTDAEGILDDALRAGRALREVIAQAQEFVDVPLSADLTLDNHIQVLLGKLDNLVCSLPRMRMECLYQEICRGRPVQDFRFGRRETSRVRALRVLGDAITSNFISFPDFPGPDKNGSSWLTWFWDLDQERQKEIAENFETTCSEIADFLYQVPQEHWFPEDVLHRMEAVDRDSSSTGAPIHFIASSLEVPPVPDQHVPGLSSTLLTPSHNNTLVSSLEGPTSQRAVAILSQGGQQSSIEAGAEQEAGAEKNVLHAIIRTKDEVPLTLASLEEGSFRRETYASSNESATELGSEQPRLVDTISAPDITKYSPIELPQAMLFEVYQEQFWLTVENQPEVVPWKRDDFAERLAEAQQRALDEREEGLAIIFALAGEQLKLFDIAPVWLVRWAFDFLHDREGASAPQDPNEVINELLEDATASKPAVWLRGLFCLFGSIAVPLSSTTVNDLASLLGLGHDVTRLAEHWNLSIRRGNPSEMLRRQIREMPREDTQQLEVDLHEARQKLAEETTNKYSAAGGRIERTHCREAWAEFMSKAHSNLVEFASHRQLNPQTAHKQIVYLRKAAASIFDRREVKFGDRNKMDRTVRDLLDLASNVVRLTRRITDAQNAADTKDDLFPPDVLQTIIDASHITSQNSPDASILRWVHDHVLADGTSKPPRLGLHYIQQYPLVLEAWKDPTFTDEGLDPWRCADPVLAAARLHEPPSDINSEEALISWLASHRPSLLTDDRDGVVEVRPIVIRHEQNTDDKVAAITARLRTVLVLLDQLADGQYDIGAKALEEAEIFRRDRSAAIRLAWIHKTAEVLELRSKKLVEVQAARALNEGMASEEIRVAIEAGALDTLLRSIGVARRDGERRPPRFRVTSFRAEAALQWPDPAQTLNHPSLTGSDDEVQRLVKCWNRARHRLGSQQLEASDDLALREAFLDVVFERTARSRKTASKSFTPRVGAHYTQIRSEDVRKWLEDDVGNPTFLPQFAQIGSLIVKVLPLPRKAPHLARKVVQEVQSNDLTILLAPGLEVAQREAIRDGIASPDGGLFAIIDDLNLVRILNPGGDQPPLSLGLLEIVAEQQPWVRFCPYEVVDGQHVRLEMFVGRKDEAHKLVRQASYSRIFSGRRLGKSALLRFAAGHSDFRTLPSGNSLHVVFCPIAGMSSEDEVARIVVRQLSEHLDESEPPESNVACMKAMLLKLIKDRPNYSFLLLLDEADTFFDEQVRRDDGHQNTLAWWMSRHAEEARDSMGLPRLRFVFCGYLHTDQNRSVWENKGDVLLLGPLGPADAMRLIAGPLARIGINATAQADAIAFRCGYQPAVIVRFGLCLIEHLTRTRPRHARDSVLVTEADVTAVMHRNEVQKAIAEACWLNFVGHPVGKLVFAALLLELAERLPNAMLTDLGDIVVRRVRSVEPSFAPQRLYSGEWSDFIHKVARELVDRSLLIQSNAYKPFEFGLRFPHHLLTLLGEDPSQHIRDALGRIGAAPTNPPTWVLTEEMLDNLRWLLEEGSKIGVIGTAIPTHWSTPVLDADAGLAARLSGRGSAVQVITATAEVSDYKGAAFALFVGGTSLTRAALARETEFFDVEVQRTGRMSQEQIAVWFQRRRATEFTGLNALSRLMAETGGLPLLVGALDVAILKMETAPSLGDAELNELLMALERQRGDLAASLYPGAGDDALSEEELALLRLVVRASDDFGQEDFAAAIEARLIDGADVAFGPTATLSVHLLVVLGLLPREVGPSNRAFRDIAGWVGPNDVIRRILAHLPT